MYAMTHDMTRPHVWHDWLAPWVEHIAPSCFSEKVSLKCGTWLIHTFDMTHAYFWHDSFTRVAWLIHACDGTHSYVRHESCMCDMTHSYVLLENLMVLAGSPVCEKTNLYVQGSLCATLLLLLICAICLIHICDMTQTYLRRDLFMCVTWLIHMCDMTHSYVPHCPSCCPVRDMIHT